MAFAQVLDSSSQIMNWKRSFGMYVSEWRRKHRPQWKTECSDRKKPPPPPNCKPMSGSPIVRTHVKWQKHFTRRQNIPHNIRTLQKIPLHGCCHVVGIKMPYRLRKWENRKTIIVNTNFPLPFMHFPRPNPVRCVCVCARAVAFACAPLQNGEYIRRTTYEGKKLKMIRFTHKNTIKAAWNNLRQFPCTLAMLWCVRHWNKHYYCVIRWSHSLHGLCGRPLCHSIPIQFKTDWIGVPCFGESVACMNGSAHAYADGLGGRRHRQHGRSVDWPL